MSMVIFLNDYNFLNFFFLYTLVTLLLAINMDYLYNKNNWWILMDQIKDQYSWIAYSSTHNKYFIYRHF